jgi:hypothetical protein
VKNLRTSGKKLFSADEMPNWIPLNNHGKYGLMDTMSSIIAKIERMEGNFLPDLRTDPNLAMASDYSGEHKKAEFHVLSYLLADRPGILQRWDHERRVIRQKFLQDGRRIAFKSLGDGKKQKALGPFLSSACSINGVLFCIAIEKTIKSLTYNGLPTAANISEWSNLPWSPKVFEKLMRILNFGTFLVSGLCRIGQNLVWITDEDEIVPNESFQEDACRIASRWLHHYHMQEMGDLTLGVAGKFEDERRTEDLVSIVDLAGGALSELFSTVSIEDIPESPKVVVPMKGRISTKSQLIMTWLCEKKRPLKKMIWVVRSIESGGVRFSFLNLQNLTSLIGGHLSLWLPPDKGWKKSSGFW